MDFVFYLGSLAVVYGLLGIQYFYGWNVRRVQLPVNVALDGLRSALTLIGVAVASGLVAALTLRYGLRTASLTYFGYAIVFVAIVLRLWFRFLSKRATA